MSVTRADELDARPADNAKELLALAEKLDAWTPSSGNVLALIARERRMAADALRLSARHQASVNELLDALERLERQNETWEDVARALLAKYDIFEKVGG